ncbi:DUF2846 domain-containing protein [Parendozoicomonas haliclonae]|uniref:DUF2846 domain-containing protein n=1 Tax=Parendozoicomonas haliclonae TaxID=1960125 RepID=A0A1X7AI49_9GAMM|nr:DUF2846 domain-containing protein [Parendozoicomonas haliclonae]SMA44148.1 hypothetical protein EHSB41UT_01743 [Parendozoicomonas haliclonae]
MKKLAVSVVIAASFLTGCATVKMESSALSESAKQFTKPAGENAGFYIFRKDTIAGAALKKDIWLNDLCIGESAKGTFFYQEVPANTEYTVSTESEFSPNTIQVQAQAGELYFVEQYIKMGLFVGGADLKLVEKGEGMAEVSKLNLASTGLCSSTK